MSSSRKYKTKKNKTRRIKKTDAYVINLDKATERWDKIQKDFKNTNIHLIRVSAVENSENPKQGLLDSFKNIIRIAKEKNLETVLVLEDDSYPTPDFNKRWATTKKWLDANMDKWEIFNGGVRIHYLKKKKTEKIIMINESINIYKTSSVEAANFLYVNSSMYNKILSWNFDDTYTALDHLTGNFRKTNMLYIYPLLSKQQNGLSYIKNTNRVLDDIYIENENYFNNFNKESLINNDKTNAYVINLTEAKERWNKIQKDFKDTNLHLIRVAAVKNSENPRQGLLDSIKKIIRKAQDNNLPAVLIMEDDSYPTEHFNYRWNTVKKWLDTHMNKWEIFNGGVLLYNRSKIVTLNILNINEYVRIYKSNYINSHNFVYINSNCYNKFLNLDITPIYDNLLKRNKRGLDNFTGDFKYFNSIYIYPQLAKQNNGNSFLANTTDKTEDYKRMDKYINTLENKI
jgi:GR25 family glycosyltransferase involved in LPS biosynthesis